MKISHLWLWSLAFSSPWNCSWCSAYASRPQHAWPVTCALGLETSEVIILDPPVPVAWLWSQIFLKFHISCSCRRVKIKHCWVFFLNYIFQISMILGSWFISQIEHTLLPYWFFISNIPKCFPYQSFPWLTCTILSKLHLLLHFKMQALLPSWS